MLEEKKIKEIEAAIKLLDDEGLILPQSKHNVNRWINAQRETVRLHQKNRVRRGRAAYDAYMSTLGYRVDEFPRLGPEKWEAWSKAAEAAVDFKAEQP